MRVGVVAYIPDPTTGGGWTLSESLVRALETVESHHAFIYLNETRYNDKVEATDRQTHEFLRHLRKKIRPSGLGDWLARGARHLVKRSNPQNQWAVQVDQWVRTCQIDIVWFLDPFSAWKHVTSGLSAPFIASVWDLEHRNRPYFPEVSVFGWDWESRERTYRSVLPRASCVLTGTHAGRTEIVQYYAVNPDNVNVVPLPVPSFPDEDQHNCSGDIHEKYEIRGDFLLYPAQFWPHKNHVNLLIALDLLKRKRGMAIGMVFTGSDQGNASHVLGKVNELGLHNQVRMLGFVPREDLRALYCTALALTFTSFFGPDNLPPLEAFALGCPVIASRASGAEEQLGDAALLFNPADPEDLAAAIFTISHDRNLRARLVQKGAEIAARRTPQAYIAQVCNILDEFEPIRRCWGHNYKHL